MRFTNLDIDALRSFVTGMELGSFTRAADRLGRSTSAISAQLKKLEEQAGVPLVRKSGRGLALTASGELALSYGRRILALNDEAVEAVKGVDLEGWVRLGLQEDFGEPLLPRVLGGFARSHPRVRIEGRIARNSELVEKIASGDLDLAVAWGGEDTLPFARKIADVPLCWLGAEETNSTWRPGPDAPLALAALEAPCLFRSIACDQLDRQGRSWRMSFVSPSLTGLGAAVAAGLGISVRTPIGVPRGVRILDPETHGLPDLPSLGLVVHRAGRNVGPTAEHLASILCTALADILPDGCRITA